MHSFPLNLLSTYYVQGTDWAKPCGSNGTEDRLSPCLHKAQFVEKRHTLEMMASLLDMAEVRNPAELGFESRCLLLQSHVLWSIPVSLMFETHIAGVN